MGNKQIDTIIDTIDRKCDIVLEQLRMKYIDPTEAIRRLQEFYKQLRS